ncbi:MAG: type II secretion system F family protein [Chloroflexota bacterium]
MILPVFLSLLLASGVYLTFDGLVRPRPQTARGPRWTGASDFLMRAGLREVTPRDFVVFSIGAGALAGITAQLVLNWVVLSVVAGGAGLLGPYAYYLRRHNRRRTLIQDTLVDAIEHVRDGIRAGLSVPQALSSLARSGPEPLRGDFAALTRETRLLGFEPALLALRDRLADPVFDVVATALIFNDRLGGRQVSEVLDRLADASRAQLRIQQDIRAQQARTVLSARIVAAAPLVALIGLRASNPRYLEIFDSLGGQLILLACALGVGLGYIAMLILTRLPEQRRVLVR